MIMITSMDFPAFCKEYYNFAHNVANSTIASCVRSSGPLNKHIDQDSVKAIGIMDALDKVFVSFDPARNARVDGLLATAVRNSVLTELGKETTRIRRFNVIQKTRRAKESEEDNRFRSITPGVRASGITGETWEPAEMMDIFGKEKGKMILLKKVMSQIQKLPPSDQTIISVWMSHDSRRNEYEDADSKMPLSYVDDVNSILGLELTSNAVYIRLHKAIAKLKKLCTGINPDYRDLYVPGTSSMIFGNNVHSSSVEIAGEFRDGEPVSHGRPSHAYSHIDYNQLKNIIAKKYYD